MLLKTGVYVPLYPLSSINHFAFIRNDAQFLNEKLNALVNTLLHLYDIRHRVHGINDPSALGMLALVEVGKGIGISAPCCAERQVEVGLDMFSSCYTL
jgi:hypothetical protein